MHISRIIVPCTFLDHGDRLPIQHGAHFNFVRLWLPTFVAASFYCWCREIWHWKILLREMLGFKKISHFSQKISSCIRSSERQRGFKEGVPGHPYEFPFNHYGRTTIAAPPPITNSQTSLFTYVGTHITWCWKYNHWSHELSRWSKVSRTSAQHLLNSSGDNVS